MVNDQPGKASACDDDGRAGRTSSNRNSGMEADGAVAAQVDPGPMRRVVVVAVAAIAPIVVLLVRLTTFGHTPDPLPTHWNIQFHPDAFTSATGFFVAILVIALTLALATAASVLLATSVLAGRMLATVFTYSVWIVAAVYAVSVLVSAGATDAHDVDLPWYGLALVLVIPIALAALCWTLLPSGWRRSVSGVAPRPLALAQGERATWIGHAHSTVLRWACAVLALAALALLIVRPELAIPAFVLAVLSAFFSEVGVRVDAVGLHTLWGPFNWPHSTVALRDITTVRTMLIEPMQWGGWGYRISPRGVAAVVRRGPGIVVDRAKRPPYAVTVDDAEQGADLLNALLVRNNR